MKRLSFFLICLFSFSFHSYSEDSTANNLGKIYEQLGLAQNISYAAQMVIQGVEGASQPVTFQMFYKNGNIRTEGEQSGMKFTMIMRMDGTIYSYNDAMKKWVKTSMSSVMGANAKLPEYAKIGTEEVDGKSCLKYEATDQATGIKNTVWVYDGIIYKNLNKSPTGSEQTVFYNNLEKKDFDDALFMPPPGEEVQDMSEMLKSLMSGATANPTPQS